MRRGFRLLAWALVVAGAGVLAWLALQYGLLAIILTDATNVDAPMSMFMAGFFRVLVSRIAIAAAIVLAIGAAILKCAR